MDVLSLINSISRGEPLSSNTIVEEALISIKYEPWNIELPNETNLEDVKLPHLIDCLCKIPDFNHLPAPGKALVMALWTTVRKRLCPISVHGAFTHSVIDLHLVEIIYSHLVKSHVESTWYRSITSWFTLIYKTEEDVLGVASESIQEYLDAISSGDTPKLLDLSKMISPYITLPHLNSWTLLHYACSLTDMTFRMKEIIDILIHTGINVNEVDACGRTPLHIAAQHFNHAALLVLSQSTQISKTVRDRWNRLPLDLLAETVAKKKYRGTPTAEKLVTMIKLLLPDSDVSQLWTIWKCDNENHPRRYRECCIYNFVSCCDEQVAIDLLLMSSNIELDAQHRKSIIVEMILRCIFKRKIKVLPLLLHMYNSCDQDSYSRVVGNGKEILQLQKCYECCEHYNLFMIKACQQNSKEAIHLLLEIFWPVIVKYWDSPKTGWIFRGVLEYPKCFAALFSRYHVYAVYNEIDGLNHELKQLPHWMMSTFLFTLPIDDHSVVTYFTDDSNGKDAATRFLEEKERNSDNCFNAQFITFGMNSYEDVLKYPLLVWACISHGCPSYLRVRDGVMDGEASKPGHHKSSVNQILSESNRNQSNILDILLRKLFSVVDGDILHGGPNKVRYLLCQSIYFSFLCGNLKSLEVLQSFLGLASFSKFLTHKNIRGEDDSNRSLLQDLYSICTRDFLNWQFVKANGTHAPNWHTLGCPRYIKKCLKFTQSLLQKSLLSSFDQSSILSCSPFNEIDVMLISQYCRLKQWLQQNIFSNAAQRNNFLDSKAVFQAVNILKEKFSTCQELSDYYYSRIKQWNEVRFLVNENQRTFFVGLRKLTKKFPPDENWVKLSYMFQLYMDLASNSNEKETINDSTIDGTQAVTAEKRDWDKFVKSITAVFRTLTTQQSFTENILSLSAFPLCVDNELSSVLGEKKDKLNWQKVFDNEATKKKWTTFSKIYNKEIQLKVILHRKNVTTGRRSIFDCDYENENKKDKCIAFVFKTLSQLLKTVAYDGMMYQKLSCQIDQSGLGDPHEGYAQEDSLASNISRFSFLQVLEMMKPFDALHFYVQSRPPWFVNKFLQQDGMGAPDSENRVMRGKSDSLLALALSPQSINEDEHQRDYSNLFELFNNIQWMHGIHCSPIKSGMNHSRKQSNADCLREKYADLQMHNNLSYQEVLQSLVDLSFQVHNGDQLSFVLPLCLLKCYDVAEKILKAFMEKRKTAIWKERPEESDSNPNATVEMYQFYYYSIKSENERFPEMANRIIQQFFHGDSPTSKRIDNSRDDIFQWTPIHLALLDGNQEFISTFFKCFPKFPLNFNQLYNLINEEKLYDKGLQLLSKLVMHKADDLGPLGSLVINQLSGHPARDVSKPYVDDCQYQPKDREIMTSFFQLLCDQAFRQYVDRCEENIPTRSNYSYSDPQLLYDYSVEVSYSSQNLNDRESAISPPKLCLMDGTLVPVDLVKSNRYILMRALPAPSIAPGFYGDSMTLMHLCASNGKFELMEALIIYNPDWINYLDYPDKSGRSPLYYCVAHQQHALINRLLRFQINHKANNGEVEDCTNGNAMVKKMIDQAYQSKYSLVKWIEAHNKHQMEVLRNQHVSLHKTTKNIKFSPIMTTFANVTKGIPHDSLLQRLSLMLEYTKFLWESIISQRDFLKFVHFSVSSSLWSKMDSIVRARQILTILGIPYSYLTNSLTTVNTQLRDSENADGKGKPIKEVLFDFEPHALLQKITPSIHNQLRFLISGWFRLRISEVGQVHPTSMTAALSDCLFTFHSQKENCVQFGIKMATKGCLPKPNVAISKTNVKGKAEGPSQAEIVREMVRVEMVSNRENSVGNGSYGWNISDAATKYAEDLSDALQSAFLLLEFAKCLCTCRILSIATFDQYGQTLNKGLACENGVQRRKQFAFSEEHLKLPSALRFKQHPIHQLNQQLKHHEQQVKWLSTLSSEPMIRGLGYRLPLVDLLLPNELRSFLKFNVEYSKRVTLLKEFLCNGLIALMVDFCKPQYCELLTRLLLPSKLNLGATQESDSVQESVMTSATTISTTDNKSSRRSNTILSDDLESLNLIIEFLKSLKIADFWGRDDKYKNFMHVFGSMNVRPTASVDGQLLVDLVKSLKMGNMLEINDEEEQSIMSMFSIMNPDLKLTSFRREQLIAEVTEQLRITLKVTSELYWFLTSVYGLLTHSSMKIPINTDIMGAVSPYHAGLFSEDASINKVESHSFDPRMILARPPSIENTLQIIKQTTIRKPIVKSLFSPSSVYKDCIDKVFHLVTRESHIETNVCIIQQAAVLGNIDLLQQCHSALKIISETPSLHKHIQYLIFHTLLLCPVPCDSSLEKTFNISYPQSCSSSSEPVKRLEVQSLYEKYCQCVKLLVNYRFPLLVPPDCQRKGSFHLTVLDLALIKCMSWEIISKIVSVSPSLSSIQMECDTSIALMKASPMTILLLCNYRDINTNRDDMTHHIQDVIVKMFVALLSSTNVSVVADQFSINHIFHSKYQDPDLGMSFINYGGHYIMRVLESLECNKDDMSTNFGPDFGQYMLITFKRCLAQFSRKSMVMGKSKLIPNSHLLSICLFTKDIMRFLLSSDSETLVDADYRCWSWTDLALLSKNVDVLRKCLSFFTELQAREHLDESVFFTVIKSILLQAVHRNDLDAIKCLFDFVCHNMSPEEWHNVINSSFAISGSFEEGEYNASVEFQLIDKMSEYHDRSPLLVFMLNHQLEATASSFVKMLCGGLTNEEILCEVIKALINQSKRNNDRSELDNLQNMTICYDDEMQKEMLTNQDTIFHVICRRGFTKLAGIFIIHIFELKLQTSLQPTFGSIGLLRNYSKANTTLGVPEQGESVLVDSLNSNKESPLLISIAQGNCSLTRLLGSYCPLHVHTAVRIITVLFRMFALNRKAIKEKFVENRNKLKYGNDMQDNAGDQSDSEYDPYAYDDDYYG